MEVLKEKFITDLLSKPPEKIVSHWMMERIPHVFDNNLELYIDWKHTLGNKIHVDSASILVIGSSSVGISLNPNKNYKDFDPKSDIDVAIISDYFFNESWRYMRNLGPKIYKLSPLGQQSILDHVQKYIYWGTIATDNILAYLPFGATWGNALNEMSNIKPTEGRTINARIYNLWC